MRWCPYCKGSGWSQYTCALTNNYAPYNYVSNYCNNYNKCGECPNYKQYGPTTSSSPCFITTVTCNILSKDDNDIVMQKLRGFRDNVLQKNEKYYEILKLYDCIGPLIAGSLINDKEKEIFTKVLYSILEKVTILIDKKEYDLAIEKYRIMTLLLINRYNLKHLFNNMSDSNFGYTVDDFDPQSAGHGFKLTNPDFIKSIKQS